jgi:copper chaperone CopZ
MTTSNNTTSILKVNGMKCHNCAGRVEKEMRSLVGVYDATVNSDGKTVVVIYDASKINLENMVIAIRDLGHGYEVSMND